METLFKIEVVSDSSGKYFGNAMTYENFADAKYAAINLAQRWLLVTAARVVEFDARNDATINNTIVF